MGGNNGQFRMEEKHISGSWEWSDRITKKAHVINTSAAKSHWLTQYRRLKAKSVYFNTLLTFPSAAIFHEKRPKYWIKFYSEFLVPMFLQGWCFVERRLPLHTLAYFDWQYLVPDSYRVYFGADLLVWWSWSSMTAQYQEPIFNLSNLVR